MKAIKDYIDECGEGCATPASTMGMGNPSFPGMNGDPNSLGSEGIPTAKSKKEKIKKKKKQVDESMKFYLHGFLTELSALMKKYEVSIKSDTFGTWFEDKYGEKVLDLTVQDFDSYALAKKAVKTK